MRNVMIVVSILLTLFFVSTVSGDELVFIAGETKIVMDKDENLRCSYCGYGENFVPITGPTPSMREPRAFFMDRFLIIVREDQGTSCPSGEWYAIDLRNHISKVLPLPNCTEPTTQYIEKNGKLTITFSQGKRTTKYSF